MLRTADKRLFLGVELTDIMVGRSAAEPPVAGFDAWYDASDVSTLTITSGRVDQWNDKGPNGYHLTQATLADKPFYDAGRQINGVTVLDFQSDQYMTSAWPRDDRSCATFAVIVVDDIAGVKTIVSGNGTGSNHMRVSNDDLQTSTSASVMAELSNVMSAATPCVVAQNLTETTIEQRVNDDASETDANASGFTAGRTAVVGTNGANVNIEEHNGLLAELIGYPFTLTDPEMDDVIAWLMAKWAIA